MLAILAKKVFAESLLMKKLTALAAYSSAAL
jgi:hypothetical protein